MPTYVFRCEQCGPFERRAPITAVPDAAACPGCTTTARRGITAPALNAPSTAHRVAAAHERSAHAPGVVAGIPADPAPRPRGPADPRLARLPRP